MLIEFREKDRWLTRVVGVLPLSLIHLSQKESTTKLNPSIILYLICMHTIVFVEKINCIFWLVGKIVFVTSPTLFGEGNPIPKFQKK